MTRYRLREVVEMTGITKDQVRYAERQGYVQTGRSRRFCHYKYTSDEIMRLCRWFGVDVPQKFGGDDKIAF
jgi:DNA-binding transcriptional MerR regulator